MDLLGLAMFSISVALFGGFHKILLTDIRPENSFLRRLYGGFRSGYVLGKLGEILDIVLPVEQPNTALENLDRSLHINPTVYNSSMPPLQTCPVPAGALSSAPMWPGHTPERTPARNFFVPRALAEILNFFSADRVLWFSRFLETRRTFLLNSNDTFILHVGTALLVLSVICIYSLFAITMCKLIRSNLVGRARAAFDEIDNVLTESELQRSLLLRRMEPLKTSVETVALFQATAETLQQRVTAVASTFNQCSDELLEECALLKKAVYEMRREYSTQPPRDDLFDDCIKIFKDSFTAVKIDIAGEIDQLKDLIPNYYISEFHRAVRKFDGNT
ncbi:hypothetical protein ACJ72_01789, partial [Emergomyces africanus]